LIIIRTNQPGAAEAEIYGNLGFGLKGDRQLVAKYFRFPWALGAYVGLAIMVLRGALGLGFLGDDPQWILSSQGEWFDFTNGAYQFAVLDFALINAVYEAFGLNPLPYHALLLALVILNAALVYLLGRTLGFEPWKCWVAGLLALFNSVASEAYFWVTQMIYVLMTGGVLAGLILLVRWRQGGSVFYGLGYLFLVVLTPLVESKGLILPLLGIFLDLYLLRTADGNPKRTILSGWGLQALALGLGGLMFLGRRLLGVQHYVTDLPWPEKWFTLKSTLISTFFHGLDDHLRYFFKDALFTWLPRDSMWLLLVMLVLAIWALVQTSGLERRLVLSLLLLWIGACLPHVWAANWQYRYFYFPGVFAALVLADLLGVLYRRWAGRAGILLVSLMLLGYLYLDVQAFRLSLASFSEASQIYEAGIRGIRERLPQLPTNARLVLIDFPDYIYSRQEQGHPGYWPYYYVYVFRNAVAAHLKLLYGNKGFKVTHLKLGGLPGGNGAVLGEPASEEEVAARLAVPHTYAFRYLGGNPPKFISWGKETDGNRRLPMESGGQPRSFPAGKW